MSTEKTKSRSWKDKAKLSYPPESGAPQPKSGERFGQWYSRLKRWEEQSSQQRLSEALATRDPDRILGDMSNAELLARQAGWYPTREAHVMFKESTGVCRALREGETHNDDLDSFVSRPLRHAKDWAQALDVDEGVFSGRRQG